MNKTTRYKGNIAQNRMYAEAGFFYTYGNNIYFVQQNKRVIKLYGSDFLDPKIANIVDKTQLVEQLNQKFGGAFHFQGSKNSLEQLNQLTSKNNGDVWQIGQKEYAYNGTDWVLLGFNMDLSEYAKIVNVYTKTEIDNKGYLTQHQDISGKVDKVDGKSLISDTEIERLANVNNYDDTAITASLNNKIDKDSVYTKTEIDNKGYLTQHQDISGKVDKVDGKGLSTNDYTTEQKEKLAGLSNYDDTAITSSISTSKEEAIASAKSTSLQIDGSNALNKVLVISQKTTEPAGPRDTQKHKMTIQANPVGYGMFSFNYKDSQNNTFTTSLQLSSSSDEIVVKSEADATYAAKATTLDGYGITDAKIDSGVITLRNNTITPLTEHQDISNKLDNVGTNKQGEIITALSTGKVAVSGKTIGDETLGYTVSGDTLTNNIKTELGITDQNFSVFIGRHSGGTIYPNFNCDLVYLHTNGYALHRYLQDDQNEWKTYKSDNATDGVFKYNVTEENTDGESAQLLIDQLPTTYGVVGAAGTDEKDNNPITGNFILKIKTLSDNVVHQFEVGLFYSDKIVATEKAVKNEIESLESSLPTKLSQFTNDVPYLTKTCLPFPDDLIDYAEPAEASTTLAFCQAFDNLGLSQKGRIYLGEISNFSDMPFPGNAECLITVCEDGVMTLELFSTTTECYHWTATYPGTVGDSSLTCPWKGNLTCPVTTIGDAPVYTPTKEYDATTKKYVDAAVSSITTCSPIPTSVNTYGTTKQFCDDMINTSKGNAKVGMMYMGTIHLTDVPLDMQNANWSTSNHTCEILVKVIGNGILELDLTSTSYRQRCWKSMYNNGYMQYGDATCPWFACLMTSVSGGYDETTANERVLDKAYRGASQKYVDDIIGNINTILDNINGQEL